MNIIIFCSEVNMVDLLMKNLSNRPFESPTSRYVNCELDLKILLSPFQSRGSEVSHIIEEGCYRIADKREQYDY